MWGDMGSMGSGWGMFGMLHMVLWWVLIVLGIVVLLKWLFGSPTRAAPETGSRALEVLRERYARGEIESEEFEKKKRDLAT